MGYRADFDLDRALVRVVQSGADNEPVDAIDAMERVRADARFAATTKMLVDLREGSSRRTMLDAVVLSELLKAFFCGRALAYVVPDALQVELEYAASVVNDDRPLTRMAVFKDLAAAEAWLAGER